MAVVERGSRRGQVVHLHPTEPALHVDQVSRRFDGRRGLTTALADVSLDVRQGEFVCVVGPSGCGKSTLLDLLAGHQRPDTGHVWAHGAEVVGPDPRRMMIFQDHALFPWLSVRQNVELGLRLAGVARAERRRRATGWLERVHLERFADALVHELSGGMRQRVSIARALALDPDVLLMDEPFAALDAQTRDLLHGELQALWRETGKTVVFITHNVREAVLLGDRVVVMTAHPGTIRRIVPVDLPRPRHMEDPGLIDLARGVLADLRDEVPGAPAQAAG
ncbi:MAG TPA: ABC transporter ATP-binding protein [Mycobacteriales bacterium]|nr:ABC transporter ATP-binding protein [Mycobacteriales bacterium]